MLILFDHSTPAPLRQALTDHVVVEAVERGWGRLANGALLDAAERGGFELLITADKNLRYQQNLARRKTPNGQSCAVTLTGWSQPCAAPRREAISK